MKKLLGLLAMILVISSLSLAENDQDILKNISLDSKWNQTYYDKDGNDANRLGNEGFKKKIKKDSDGLKKWKELWVLTTNGD